MIQAGGMWILENDKFFAERFEKNHGKFDYEHLVAALQFVDNWDFAIDCGAHYGSWSLPISKKFKQVISIEGRPDLYECLTRNIEGTKNIDARLLAVGDRFDSVSIGISEQWPGKDGNTGVSTVLGSGSTQMIPIDSLDIQHLDFLKIDIEGYELFALKGAEETLKRCKPVIIFEENRRCLEHGVQRGDCGAYLEKLGATMVKKLPGINYVYKWV